MTKAERAFELAEAEIAAAYADGWEKLDFSTEDFRALERLPSTIADLNKLRGLDLNRAQVSDLRALSGLTSLTQLWLNNTQVSDLRALSGLTSLTVLRLSATPVSDLSALSDLTSLMALGLSNTQVSDLSALSGLTSLATLGLSNTQVSDLSPLSGLTSLTGLWLNDTQVSDLSPLSGLTYLTALELNYTQVSDLSPLHNMWKLVDDPDGVGLSFKNIPAAKNGPRIAEISEIKDNAERASALFEYLGFERPDETQDSKPQPDELFPIEQTGELLEVAASSPDAAELEDTLKRSMHTALRVHLDNLAKAAGNQFSQLAETARQTRKLLECAFPELDMPAIHLMLSQLRTAQGLGQEDEQAFDDKVNAHLASVMEAGPALTLDNPDVEKLMDRARRFALNPDPVEVKAAQDRMSESVAADKDAIGERLRALEERVANRPEPEAAVVQKAVNRNVLWRIAVWALEQARDNTFSIVFSGAVTMFATGQLSILYEAALTYGAFFAEWFLASLSKVPEIAAVIAANPPPPEVRK